MLIKMCNSDYLKKINKYGGVCKADPLSYDREILDSLRENEMTASTSGFPGRSPYGKKSAAIIPRRAHASIINVPHPSVHAIVHAHPQSPPTFLPVSSLNPISAHA